MSLDKNKKHRYILGEFIIPFIALGYTLYYYITAKNLVWEARIYSLVVGWIILMLVMIVLFQNIKNKEKQHINDEELSKKSNDIQYYTLSSTLIISTLLYIILLSQFGFLIPTVLYIYLTINIQNYFKRKLIIKKLNAAAFSIIFAVSVYLIFIYIFRIDLPEEYFLSFLK